MSDITTLRRRARLLLGDPDGELYPDDLLDECLLGALQQLREAAGQPDWRLQGLDGADITLLPEGEQTALALGAAASACGTRGLQRLERFDLNERVPAGLEARAQNLQREFRQRLELLRQRSLQRSEAAPYGSPWPLDEWDAAVWGGPEGA